MYLTDSGDRNITEDTGSNSCTDDKFCVDKKKKNEKEERTNIFASYNYPNSNSIDHNENLFQQIRNTFGKIGASYDNIVKQKPKNVVILTDNMLKSPRIKKCNENLS